MMTIQGPIAGPFSLSAEQPHIIPPTKPLI